MADGAPPPDGSWRGWLAYIGVGLFGLFLEWGRRQLDRWQDRKDREARRAERRRFEHRRHDDPPGLWQVHGRDDLDDEDEEG